ncbi:MAG: prepilin-type N-terminal cleavage/methylation domain-containing protein [bacterium]|nr:prepilin-type N-terminal cleavage/methylation domain-containing protein [bacterium]
MRLIPIYRYRDGFTLVELLITLIVFTFVIGMIYATYSMGIFMWKTTETKLWTVQEARMSLERIIREARGAKQGSVSVIKDTSGVIIGFKFTISNKEISFEKSGDKILRKVNNTGNNIIATNVKSFSIETIGSSYKITITFNNNYTVSGVFTPRNR